MKKILFTAFSIFFISVLAFAQFRIDTPELIAPADADTDEMPDAVLDWTAVLNATGYHVQVSADENFNNVIVDELIPLTAFENSYLMFNTTYYWRVRAAEGEEFSGWSETRSFTTFAMMELDSPGDGDDGEEAEIEFEWEDKYNGNVLSGFDKYQLQVDLDPAVYENPDADPEWNIMFDEGNGFKYTLNYMYYGDTIYWRMRAIHPNDTCEWTGVWSFITDNQISLDKPSDGLTGANLEFNIEWDEFDGTIEYEYQVHVNQSFNGALTYFLDSTEVPVPTLKYGTEYFWHVRGKNTRDTTAWSDAWSFTTAGQVLHVAPLNMVDSVELNPQLDWEPILGSDSYDLQYSTDSTFADVETINIGGHFFNIGTTLDEGTKYFWRVRACAEHDTSSYSDPWSFITMPSIGIDEYFDNNQLSIFPNPATDFATINITARKEGDVNYSITDLTGKEIQSGHISLVSGNNTKQLNLKGMTKGIYLVNLDVENSMITRKLIIK